MLSSHNLEPWDKLFIPWMPFLPALWSDKLLLILFNASSNVTCFVKCSLIAPGRVTHSCSRLPGSPPLVKHLSHHKYLLSRLHLPPTTGSKSMLLLILSIVDITGAEHLSQDWGVLKPFCLEWGLAEGGREHFYCDQGFFRPLQICKKEEKIRESKTAVLVRSACLSPIFKKCCGLRKTLKSHL